MKPEDEQRAGVFAGQFRMLLLLLGWGGFALIVIASTRSHMPGGFWGWLDPWRVVPVLVFIIPVLVLVVVLGLAWFLVLTRASVDWMKQLVPTRRWVLILVLIASLAGIAWASSMPLTVAFSISRGWLDDVADAGDAGNWSAGHDAGRAGVYRVLEVSTDPRGGTYLVTGTTLDLAHTIFHGFARSPNPSGSPFGDASYRIEHLVEDWYVFVASDY